METGERVVAQHCSGDGGACVRAVRFADGRTAELRSRFMRTSSPSPDDETVD